MAEQGSVMPKADYGRRPTTRRRCGTFADVAQKMAAMQKWIAEYRAVVRADARADGLQKNGSDAETVAKLVTASIASFSMC